MVPTKESPQNSTNIDHKEADISLDPKHFLQVETNKILQIPGELVDKMDEIDGKKFSCLFFPLFQLYKM